VVGRAIAAGRPYLLLPLFARSTAVIGRASIARVA
jgi:hypothetical protein